MANDIAYGGGNVFITNKGRSRPGGYDVQKLEPNGNSFKSFGNEGALRLTVDDQGYPWIVTELEKALYYTGSRWSPFATEANLEIEDIAFGGEGLQAWIASKNQRLFKFDLANNTAVAAEKYLKQAVTRVAATSTSTWILNDQDQQVFRLQNGTGKFDKMGVKGLDIAAFGQDVFMLDLDGKPSRWNNDTQKWDSSEFSFTGGQNIAVGPGGKLYVAKANGEIWFYEKVITQAQEQKELQAFGGDQLDASEELQKLIAESFESFVEEEVKKEAVVKTSYILDYYNFTKIFVDPLLNREKDELAAIV